MKTWTCPICSRKHHSYKRFQNCYYGHVIAIDARMTAARRRKSR